MLSLALPDLKDAHELTGAPLFSAPVFAAENSVPVMVKTILPYIEMAVYACGALLCVFSSLSVSDTQTDYGLALCAVACAVSAFFARKIVKVRDQTEVPDWIRFRYTDTTPKDLPLKFQAQEMAVDLFRLLATTIAAPLILLRLYQMVGVSGVLFDSRGIPIVLSVIASVCQMLFRAGSDELAPRPPDAGNGRDALAVVVGIVAFLAGLALHILVVIDLWSAADKSDVEQMRSNVIFVVCVSIVYPCIAVFAVVWRCCRPPMNKIGDTVNNQKTDYGYSEALSLLKDVLYAAAGIMILGFLAFGSALDAFGSPFKGTKFF